MRLLMLSLAAVILSACTPTDQAPQEELTEVPPPIPKVDKIVLEEWFDYGCHYCEQVHPAINNLKAKYGEKLEVIPRYYPLSDQTRLWAEASECARDQGLFDTFHDHVFANYYGQFDAANITKAANDINIPDPELFATCVASGAGKDQVVKDIRAAEQIGVTGTPFFRINGELQIPGAITEQSFISLFDSLLAGEVVGN